MWHGRTERVKANHDRPHAPVVSSTNVDESLISRMYEECKGARWVGAEGGTCE